MKPFCEPMLKLAPIEVLLLELSLSQFEVFCALSRVMSFFAISAVSAALTPDCRRQWSGFHPARL